jgi:endonuclease/exonuclease/phosphatase family metal-dependent hydrolase
MPAVRLLAYNVQGFRAGGRAVAAAVAEERPDVAFVNEIGRGPALGRFASTLGMEAASGVRLFRSVPNAVLCRSPWRVVDKRVIAFSRTGKLIPRGAVLVHLGRAGARLWAAAVHLGLSNRERVRHAEELTDVLAGLSGPAVVGGDLNEGPDEPAARWIGERLWDAFAEGGAGEGLTFPSSEPTARIDYLFVGEGIGVERVWVGEGERVRAAADHRPVFADVVLEDAG